MRAQCCHFTMLKTHRERHLLHIKIESETARERESVCSSLWRSQLMCQRVARRARARARPASLIARLLSCLPPTGRARAIGIFQLSAICNLWHSQCRLGPSARSRIVTVYPASSRNCFVQKESSSKRTTHIKNNKKKKQQKRKEIENEKK